MGENKDKLKNHHGSHEGHDHANHEGHEHANHEGHDHAKHSKHENHESHDHADHAEHEGHDHAEHEDHDHDHHGGHEGHHHGDFKKLFFISLIPALAVMVISPMMSIEFFFTQTFQYSDIVAAILATFLLVVGARPFFKGAIGEFKEGKPSMMALVSMGLLVSYVYSIIAVILKYSRGLDHMDFFFEFASLVLIMLLGHWIEMEAVGRASDAQESLAELLPKKARVVQDDGSIQKVSLDKLKIGDKVQIQAGESVPADGTILDGRSRFDESILTGESKPVEKTTGDKIIGGSINGSSSVTMEVEETGQDSFISQVQKLVADAKDRSSRAENMANKVASWLFYIALGAGLLAFFIWWWVENLSTGIMYMVTTLVIACPHALGLAIPLVVARSTSIGAKHGILVKDRDVYEKAKDANIIILDKTGTLTEGNIELLSIEVLDESYSEDQVLELLAGLEEGSSHPIAQSIVDYAKDQDVSPIQFKDIEVISGQGLRGTYQGETYQILSEKAYGKDLDISAEPGSTVSILVKDDQAIGAVVLGDRIKESAKDLITHLKDKDIKPIMATGDNESAAKEVAENLGIDYRSNQSPEDKHKLVEDYQDEGRLVMMVGDGVNDGPSLALADVGIAIGAGTQVALDSADVILTNSDPGDIQAFLDLSENTQKKMRQNLIWGAGYNFVAIPLAAGILAPIGISLTPAMGAILMSLSTVIVAINAMGLSIDK